MTRNPGTGKIAYVVSFMAQCGGGERLACEGIAYYARKGHDVRLFTWTYDHQALFNGRYSIPSVHVLGRGSGTAPRADIVGRAWGRFKSLFELRRMLREMKPDLVISQSEYDATLVFLATLFTGIPTAVLIFGQTYQFPHDLAKYSFVFRKHLEEIVKSFRGYWEETPLRMPPTSWKNRVANEAISLVRYFAVRATRARYTLSRQVRWEIRKLYGVDSHVLKGAFQESIFDFECDRAAVRSRLGLKPGEKFLLMVHRLHKKKRTHVAIEAMKRLGRDDVRLFIGGKGPHREELERLVQDLGLGDRVTFLGMVPEADLFPLKQSCDVFLSLDIADFDISPLEALGLGTKAIWTTEMDMDPAFQAHPGIFRTEPEPELVAETIRKALDARVEHSRRALADYTWDCYFETVLRRTLAGHGAPITIQGREVEA